MKLRIARTRTQVTDNSGPLDPRSGPRDGPWMIDYRFPPAAKVNDVIVRSQTGCLLSYMLTHNFEDCFEPGDDAKVITPCGKELSGVVLRQNPATLKTDGGIVCASACIKGSNHKDRLLTFEAARDACGRLCGYQVSYIDNSIFWTPIKNLFISCGQATLTIGARIVNGSGKEYPSVSVEFVDTSFSNISNIRAFKFEAMEEERGTDALAPIRENKSYPITAPLCLHRGETLLSSIETLVLTGLTKYYMSDISYPGSATVHYGYEFVAPEFIPRAIVYIYSVDTCDNIMYEGRSFHNSANACEETQILVASSIMVIVNSEITERSSVAGGINISGTVNITNKTGQAITLELKYSRRSEQKWPPIRVTPKPSKQLPGELIWKTAIEKTAEVQQMSFEISFPSDTR